MPCNAPSATLPGPHVRTAQIVFPPRAPLDMRRRRVLERLSCCQPTGPPPNDAYTQSVRFCKAAQTDVVRAPRSIDSVATRPGNKFQTRPCAARTFARLEIHELRWVSRAMRKIFLQRAAA